MPRAGSNKLGFAIDLGNPLLNRTVDGFLKIGAVGACKVAAEDAFDCLHKGSVSKNKLEQTLKSMCRQGAYWGTVAGVYVGVAYGVESVRGSYDWRRSDHWYERRDDQITGIPGWEGSASDSKVLKDAMRIDRQDAFVVPQGKYYLVDAGYTNGAGFLSPFRSTRYHLKEWAASLLGPQTEKELYNLRHARARNVVERCFGLLKKKWAILRSCSFFSIEDQIRIINACCVLHNYARDRQHVRDDLLMQEIDAELAAMTPAPADVPLITSVQSSDSWNDCRQDLADEMFAEYLVAHDELAME